jgi:2-phospho-L-lactate guanylyltransferase
MATRVCVERGATYTLVLPGDIPLITVDEVEAIFTAASENIGTVLAPSASGRGSNAVLRCPADLFPLRFGNDSFPPHLAAARATGHPVTVLPLPGIGLDVDDPADLVTLLMTEGETRAQRLLRQWNVARRLLAAAHG